MEIRNINEGHQIIFKFKNDYGASVVRHSFSHGNEAGLWELAVLDKGGNLTYETPVTGNVEGYLNDDQIIDLLQQVKNL